MLPSRHIIASLPLGAAVGLFTESLFAGLLCLLTGIFIDIDHIIDYINHYGLKIFNFKEVYQGCRNMAKLEKEGGIRKLYLFFHAVEFAILLWAGFIFFRNIYLLSIALGYTGHIILDVAANRMKPWAYFITLRIKNNFSTIKFMRLQG